MPSSADDLLRSGDIVGARAVLVSQIKRAPQDQAARMFLFQLLAIVGEWDKAESQLRALAQLSPEAQMLAAVYNKAIGAERARQQAFAGQAPFNVLVPSSPWITVLADSLAAFSRGDSAKGEALRDEAFDAAPDTPGELNEVKFGWIADADPRFGPAIELIIDGNWGLVPFEAIAELRSEGPRDVRDLMWLPVELRMRSGQSAAGFLPARYPGSESAEPPFQLARGTDWIDSPAGQIGLGQRIFTLSDSSEVDVLSLRQLSLL
ncbi:MAG: type VI secretion system accessory protein TagJ [Caulobacteraceae bacterium]|nr:type VI secretion system accessory protein TagJ [Caulobacteraceae bacterium]